MLDVYQQTAHGRGYTGIWRNDHHGNRQFLCDCGTMQGPCPTKGHKRKITRVIAAGDRQHAHSISHIRIGHINDCLSRFMQIHTKWFSHGVAHGLCCQLGVQCDVTACKAGAETAQYNIGVTIGGDLITVRVTGRTRVRTCGLRPVA